MIVVRLLICDSEVSFSIRICVLSIYTAVVISHSGSYSLLEVLRPFAPSLDYSFNIEFVVRCVVVACFLCSNVIIDAALERC